MKPQYLADHIGSFLRPAHLPIARARRQEGRLAADELRRIEDAAIEEVVRMQRAVGIPISPTASARAISRPCGLCRSARSRCLA